MKTRFILQSIVGTLVLCGILTGSAQGRNQYQSRNTGGQPAPQMTKSQAATGVCYALLIGVNDYKHLKQLRFCAKDMTGLKEALVKGKVVEQSRITLLVSGTGEESNPTLANINRALKNLAGQTNENDTVLFAFAGHGVSLPSRKGGIDFQQYLCPPNAEVVVDSDTGRIETDSLLALAEVNRMLTEVSKAKTRIMFLDACRDKEVAFSARTMSNPSSTKTNVDSTSNLKNFTSVKLETSGFYQLSSCNNGQQAYEDVSDMKHGVFSYYLIEGLGGAADKRADKGKGGNGDGQISLDELGKYVSTKTANYVHNEMKKTQTPTFSAVDTYGESPLMAWCEKEKVEVASNIGGNIGGGSTNGGSTNGGSTNGGSGSRLGSGGGRVVGAGSNR